MKLKVVWRKMSDYVRYDLKEIAFPSSLPDPPHIIKRKKLTWIERYLDCTAGNLGLCTIQKVMSTWMEHCLLVPKVLKEASRLYAASWRWLQEGEWRL
ncbi:embryo defective [Thalictrum thalictroides]|uniref:Embryo defective n=1 Tax=Thalictrum thalictroides TaxID=46969 RepID=A0A7J6X1Z2_THATH|nr:embryo defective [Thalictrum thalictroides]